MVYKDYVTVLIIDQANGCIIFRCELENWLSTAYIGFAYLMKILDIDRDRNIGL